MKKEKYVKICPKCGSKDVSSDLSVASIARGSFQNDFKCNKCEYKGMFFPEIGESKLKEYRKKLKKK
tara:strand:- start:291 stop:491 length:201 start_codon:yes stop_codon:yes gene_type:complete